MEKIKKKVGKKKKWRCRGSNPGPLACEASALPLSYIPNHANFLSNSTIFKQTCCTLTDDDALNIYCTLVVQPKDSKPSQGEGSRTMTLDHDIELK